MMKIIGVQPVEAEEPCNLIEVWKWRGRMATYGQTNLLWDECLCGVDAGSFSSCRMKSETTPNNGDTPNTHSPSAQGVGGR